MERHGQLREHLDSVKRHIRSCNNLDLIVRRDLLRMHNTCETTYTEMDREMVECRRKRRPTSRYTELESKLTSMISTLEKRITWANLL